MIMQLTFSDIPTDSPLSGDAKLATRLRTMADKLTSQIEDKRRPLSQNPTPKRMRELAQRRHDGANLERVQKALYALADLHETGQCPADLADLKTKSAIEPLVRTRGESAGYYDYSDSGEFADASAAGHALQALISGNPQEQAALKRKLEIERLEAKAKMDIGQIPGFYPTPAHIAREMVQAAQIEPCMSVLEPSAGSGAIADVIHEMCPKANIAVCERNYGLRELLKLKDYYLIGDDFLEHFVTQNGVDGWHRILMNPPFENGQDAEHVRHAYDCLKNGGRIVAIMCESAFFRNTKAAREFRDWFDEHGYTLRELDAGELESSGVKSRIVILDK